MMYDINLLYICTFIFHFSSKNIERNGIEQPKIARLFFKHKKNNANNRPIFDNVY